MDNLNLVNQALQPKTYYRPCDVADVASIPLSEARRQLRRLLMGDCVECVKQGSGKVYLTKQMSLI